MASFYADHDIAAQTVYWLRQLGHDVTTTRALHQERASDAHQLWTAALNGWILVTHNTDDYRLLHEAWQLWGVDRAHNGVLVIPHWQSLLPQWAPEAAARELASFMTQHLSIENQLYIWQRRTGWSPILPQPPSG